MRAGFRTGCCGRTSRAAATILAVTGRPALAIFRCCRPHLPGLPRLYPLDYYATSSRELPEYEYSIKANPSEHDGYVEYRHVQLLRSVPRVTTGAHVPVEKHREDGCGSRTDAEPRGSNRPPGHLIPFSSSTTNELLFDCKKQLVYSMTEQNHCQSSAAIDL